MSSNEEKLNTSNMDVKFWQDFSPYKKALYLTQNAPDCSFVIAMDAHNAKSFPAHKAILESASPVFEQVFNSNNNTKDVTLSETEPQVFKKFLDFIYYGDEENLRCADANTLRNLIALGKRFKVEDLIKNCVETMKRNLANAENYDLINIFEYACFMEDNELIKECKRVIIGRAKANHKFTDFNFNQQSEEKRHIAQAKKQLSAGPPAVNSGITFSSMSNGGNRAQATQSTKIAQPNTSSTGGLNILGTPAQSSTGLFCPPAQASSFQTSPFSFASTPTNQPTEEKLQNTESNHNDNANSNLFALSSLPIGLNKGKITDCVCIYNLTASVFYELQVTLCGHISELLRFNMIETYAKINGLISADVVDVELKDFAKPNAADTNKLNSDEDNKDIVLNGEKTDSMPENRKKAKVALAKQILNMLIRSVKFHRMTAKEFCSGPGKSSLLDMEEKYDLLVTIVNKN